MRTSQSCTIDCANPINRGHWSVRGMVAYYQVVPGLSGGAVFHDLLTVPGDLKQGNHGILAGSPPPKWQPTSRPGGLGQLSCAAAGYFTLPDVFPKGNAPRSFALWFRTSSTPLQVLFDYGDLSSSSTHTRNLVYIPTSFRLTFDCFGANVTGNTVINDGKWHLGVITFNGALGSVYLDGALDGTANFFTGTAPAHAALGTPNDGPGGGASFNGALDGFRAWNRSLSAAEVRAIYDLDRRGSPGLLNRLGPAAYPRSAAPAGNPGSLLLAI